MSLNIGEIMTIVTLGEQVVQSEQAIKQGQSAQVSAPLQVNGHPGNLIVAWVPTAPAPTITPPTLTTGGTVTVGA